MIFSKESIQAILENRKSQTRRLVKEGEYANDINSYQINAVCRFRKKDSLMIAKWQVGKEYAIQPKRGAGCIGKCHACGALSYWVHKKGEQFPKQYFLTEKKCDCLCSWNPVKIRITSIRQENLNNISETDAKREGFKNKWSFLWAFCEINKKEFRKLLTGRYKKQ